MKKIIKSEDKLSFTLIRKSVGYVLQNAFISKTALEDYVAYPFACDFYIKSLDLFIELNLHWTHGGRPFDSNNKHCQEQLQLWKEKAKTSKFYKNAIYVWTVRDVKKLNTLKSNNLNYRIVYTKEEIEDVLNFLLKS